MVSCFLVNQSHCLLFSDSMYFELHCETGCGVYFITYLLLISRACPMAQMVNNLPAMQETWIWFLGQEDPLEKGMTTHSSLLAWEIPWTEQPGGLQSMGSQRVRHNWATNTLMDIWMVTDLCHYNDVWTFCPNHMTAFGVTRGSWSVLSKWLFIWLSKKCCLPHE